MPPNEEEGIAEVSLGDISNFIRRHAVILAGLTIAGVAGGWAVAKTMSPQWEATSYYQVGQIQFSMNGGPPVLLEPIAQTVERVRLPYFQNEVLRARGADPGDEDSPIVELVRSGMNAVAVPSDNAVRLVVQGFSPEQAKAYMKEMQRAMLRIHEHTFKANTEFIRVSLTQVQADRAPIQKSMERLSAMVDQKANSKNGGKDAAESLLLLSLLDKARRENNDALAQERELNDQLNPGRTFTSKVLSDITVSPDPVKPRTGRYMTAGAVLGLIAGLAVALVRQTIRRP
jgi:hypothetical protein